MEPKDPNEKLEYWREHIKKVQEFSGTQGEYCAQNGISTAKLSYYKSKFSPRPSFAKVTASTATAEKSTLPLESSRARVGVPDAKWLAIFLKELFR